PVTALSRDGRAGGGGDRGGDRVRHPDRRRLRRVAQLAARQPRASGRAHRRVDADLLARPRPGVVLRRTAAHPADRLPSRERHVIRAVDELRHSRLAAARGLGLPRRRASPSDTPGAGARDDPAGRHRQDDPRQHARGTLPGVHPHRRGEGAVTPRGDLETCAAQRALASTHGHRAPGRPPARGRDPHRDDLLLARHRPLGLRVDRVPRLRDRAGREPLHRRDRRRRESGHRRPLRRGRSSHQVRVMTTYEVAVERAAAAVAEPGRSPASAAWRRLVASPAARAGLIMVVAFVLVALLTPLVHVYDARTDADLTVRLKPPTAAHPFGTDSLGRDILVRILHATRVSLGLAMSAVALATVLGSALGFLAGYLRGRTDLVVMFCMDIVLAFPATLLAIAIVAMIGPGLRNSLFAISLVSIPAYARLSRASVLALREQE